MLPTMEIASESECRSLTAERRSVAAPAKEAVEPCVRPAAPPHPNSAFTSRSTWHHTKSISVAKADGGYNTSDEARASSICNSASNVQDAELRRRHYLALGADLSLDKPPAAAAGGQDAAAAVEKPLRRFFDEWPWEGGDTRPWTVGQKAKWSFYTSGSTCQCSQPVKS